MVDRTLLGEEGAFGARPVLSSFTISDDEQEVVYTIQNGGDSEIWMAALDRRSPPHLVTRGGDEASLGANGDVVFRKLDPKQNLVYRIKTDGTGLQEITSAKIISKFAVSPDGEWVTVQVDGARETVAFPVRGGTPRKICSYDCFSWWSADGKVFYIAVANTADAAIPCDPFAGRKNVTGPARFRNHLTRRPAGHSRNHSNESGRCLYGKRSFDVRLYEAGLSGQPVPHPAALIHSRP